MQTLPPSTSLHAKTIDCYAYAGSSFFTAGTGQGPKNASGITDEWWREIFHCPSSQTYTKEYLPFTLSPVAPIVNS